MSATKKFMILDVETIAVEGCARKVFNLGAIVADKHGNVYERARFLVCEQFDNADGMTELVEDSYCGGDKASKFFIAWNHPSDETIKCSFEAMRYCLNNWVIEYNATVCAYNAQFDFSALRQTSQFYCGCEFWDIKPKTLDIWHAALCCLCNKVSFMAFCHEYGLLKEDTGNPATGAEPVYAYLSDCPTFEEVHEGLADVDIEYAILRACWKTHKKIETKNVGCCASNKAWRRMRDKYHARY